MVRVSGRDASSTSQDAMSDSPVPTIERRDLGVGEAVAARRLHVAGRVQGVGFRPFIARLAGTCGLAGWVKNTPEGVVIHLEGSSGRLDDFRGRLEREAPAEA